MFIAAIFGCLLLAPTDFDWAKAEFVKQNFGISIESNGVVYGKSITPPISEPVLGGDLKYIEDDSASEPRRLVLLNASQGEVASLNLDSWVDTLLEFPNEHIDNDLRNDMLYNHWRFRYHVLYRGHAAIGNRAVGSFALSIGHGGAGFSRTGVALMLAEIALVDEKLVLIPLDFSRTSYHGSGYQHPTLIAKNGDLFYVHENMSKIQPDLSLAVVKELPGEKQGVLKGQWMVSLDGPDLYFTSLFDDSVEVVPDFATDPMNVAVHPNADFVTYVDDYGPGDTRLAFPDGRTKAVPKGKLIFAIKDVLFFYNEDYTVKAVSSDGTVLNARVLEKESDK